MDGVPPQLTAINRFPVKSCRGEALDSAAMWIAWFVDMWWVPANWAMTAPAYSPKRRPGKVPAAKTACPSSVNS